MPWRVSRKGTVAARPRTGATAATCAKPRGSRRGSTRTTSAGSRNARSAPSRWSSGAGTELTPPADELEHMHARLAGVVSEHFDFEHYVDDNMRNIPDHCHAAPTGRWILGHGLKRRDVKCTFDEHVLTIDLGTSGPRWRSSRSTEPSSTATANPSGTAHRRWWCADPDRVAGDLGRRPPRRVRVGRAAESFVAIPVTSQWSGTCRSTPTASCCTTRSSGWIRGADVRFDAAVGGRVRVQGYDRASCAVGSDYGGVPSRSGKDPIAHILWLQEHEPEIARATGSTSSRRTG